MRFPKLKLPLRTILLQVPEKSPRVTQFCAGIAAGIALLALLGWVSGVRFLAGQLGTYIPMAPSTALAFLLLSGVLFRFAHLPVLRLSRRFALIAVSIVLLVGLFVLVQFIFGTNLGIEQVLSRTNEWLGSTPLGRMSPLTAIAFLLEGAAFFILLIGERWRNVSTVVALLAAAATAINAVVLIGYAFGAPLLYGGTNIPVALPTALAFILVGIGQLNLAAPGVPPLREWSGASMRGILLRAFLPFLLFFILLDSWVGPTFGPMLKLNPAVWYSLKALVVGVLTVIIIGWIARRTGGEIERAQKALAESEALYRSLFENMLSGYAHCQMLFKDGKPQDFVYLDVNDAFEKLTGLKDVTGKRISEVIPGVQQSSPELFEVLGRVVLTGQSDKFETQIPSLGIWASISVYSLKQGFFVTVFDNITERKRAEEEVAWLASFPERNPNPVIEIDSTGTIFYVNPAAQHKFPDLKAQGFKHPWLAGLGDVIPRCQHEGISELQREIQIGDAWYSQPLYFVPETARLRVYGTDITERKLAEQQTVQMKRLYATLSQVNQAIVRAKSRAELYQTICDVAVKFGEFSLAWVGILDETTGDVHPVTANGMTIEQWPFPLTNLNSGPLVKGLVATAIRTSKVATSDDLQTDERIQNLQGQNQKYDFHSAASVPFRLKGKTLGVLNLISHEKDFFEAQQEVHLLDEMGLDISFALDKMEIEIERGQAEEEMRSRSRQLTALLDASQSLTESLNRAEVLQKITDKAADVLKVEASAIYLVEGEHLYFGASTPPLPPEFPETLRRAILIDHPRIAEALMTRQSVLLPDVAEATLTTAERVVSDALGLRTIMYIPLVARQDAAGILLLGTIGKPREFSKNESDVARALANQAALAIANAMLYENLSLYVKELEDQIAERKRAEERIQRQLKNLNALRMIDIAISSSFDLNIILDVVLQKVLARLEVDASAITLFNTQMQTIEYAASRGFHSDAFLHTRLKLGEGYASQAVLKRKTIHISGLVKTGGKLAKALKMANEEFVDYYGTPLIVKGEVKGVLEIYHHSYLKADSEWLEFLEALAGQAAIAIDNAQLFESLQQSNLNLEHRVAERTTELNRTNVELEHANQIKDEFLANMSHELRTPLTSILGLSESLLEERRGSLNDHQQRSLQIIESSGRHLLELINDILDLSKIEAGKFDFYPQPISVDEVSRSSLSFVKSQAVKKSITVTYTNEAAVSKIYADPRRLKQILVNLLNNAVKFTPENGNVILQVTCDPTRELIRFAVIDTGIGISPQDLKRLFRPFVQVDSSLNRQHEGTGLGLALVQRLTDLHGGSVQVESEAGKGSRFTINLPCLLEEVGKLEKLESEPTPSIRERTEDTGVSVEAPVHLGIILLADDNMPSILTIGEYLESRGYEVVVAHDGSEAVEKAEAVHPDLILMDIQMPVMNGLEAIACLRGNARFVDTPIIALTALAMPGDRAHSLLAGATEYMSKPVSLKLLARTVKELLGKQV